jgi:hypothetical protein
MFIGHKVNIYIGRGRRREHPKHHCVLLLLRKKYGKKSTGKKYGESTGEKNKGKCHVTLLLVKHAHGITSGRSSSLLHKCYLKTSYILLRYFVGSNPVRIKPKTLKLVFATVELKLKKVTF